ncbi:MAG: ribonuclease Y [Candidatus Phytoplasma stylosanthis]|uniref:ribonuclease Y n=1 Tax=Candidatus Phytoplasma stylosanthis TaxID=2798314 RepID=UPI00293970CD|nr:ribonuclease Y [Candidatus Phytoplasma stylosanthis]MDV3167801.1 ribonuclease Y [Candidatus Phytoplasma stylosanthis]MDV3170922.1 ribonuclease Y [Candidatus Phytoplasma stylosanthis]MDV3173668.1 ribonuclease Y [Candidatus Phytoplasma stylosanthis]MDV3202386.1 ribonuclease Y [Candidatus Phytoplasma stylosanthis]
MISKECIIIFLYLFYFFILLITLLYFHITKKQIKKKITETDEEIKKKISKSKLISSQLIQEVEKKISLLKKENEKDLNQRRKIIINLEEQMIHKEELLNKRIQYLDEKEEMLYIKENKINTNKEHLKELKNKIEKIIIQQQTELEKISNLTKKEAEKILFLKAKQEIHKKIIEYEKIKEQEYKFKIKNKAKELLISTMQKLSREVISVHNTSIIFLEQNELKGRIIGKEGRNIKSFEIITGVDLIIDETPNTVILSCFDPIRREIAKRTLENLINDGRITPSSIEKIFQKKSEEIDDFIQETGEKAVLETKIGIIDEELIKLLGKLQFRTSYGQNVLEHSLEVAFLAGKLASEIGENEIIARRAGLLHDIGKALDYQIEGSHVKIGVDLAIKYKEPFEVIDAISSHHEDEEAKTSIAVLVSIADTISSARPGARRESIENYIQRINQLENIANNIPGVEKSYVIRSGREIRVIIKTEIVDDYNTFLIAKKIKKQIEENLHYNGIIKITVIRELRVIESAEVNKNS